MHKIHAQNYVAILSRVRMYISCLRTENYSTDYLSSHSLDLSSSSSSNPSCTQSNLYWYFEAA
ncbi:hypothetical protein IF1G_04991 [Cordyceps javanica]|uniref:Uncharacterized protein n=1 Tax=Cordyceps javanica TaxID=43265 RepID=A0A545V3X2_9HYPO|nr:hypothetical protein IF1G_04991 [Cordyceps javanica]